MLYPIVLKVKIILLLFCFLQKPVGGEELQTLLVQIIYVDLSSAFQESSFEITLARVLGRRPKERFSARTHNVGFIFRVLDCRFREFFMPFQLLAFLHMGRAPSSGTSPLSPHIWPENNRKISITIKFTL